ncbi:MAG: hypothetical protein JSR47_08250 [Proteobacteria bacterium]|nr:hypothetical protein [Pseudomonadota bacterium]
MQYLGALRGSGELIGEAGSLGRVEYELDGYLMKPGEVVASGEIHMAAAELNEAFGRRDLRLQTDDGRLLEVRFSGKRNSTTSTVAHADVRGGLPPAREWSR